MIRSMTGFGAADGELGRSRLTIEIRAVNHRFFNPSIKLPAALARFEPDARERLRLRVARGHVTLVVRLGSADPEAPRINESMIAAYVAQLQALREQLDLTGPIDLGAVLRLPNVVVMGEGSGIGDEGIEDPAKFLAILDRALSAFDETRLGEGARLLEFIGERLGVIAEAVRRIGDRAPTRLIEQRDRLRRNVRELTEGIALDEQRVAQEIAIIADRLDVSEELHRFGTHLDAFRTTLTAPPPDGVGKRLGFLLQELLREANTTGSKANDAAMLNDVLLIKEELERVREQVENLE